MSFVDPDNRQPVDFSARSRALELMLQADETDIGPLAASLLASWPDGRIKWKQTAIVLPTHAPDR